MKISYYKNGGIDIENEIDNLPVNHLKRIAGRLDFFEMSTLENLKKSKIMCQ